MPAGARTVADLGQKIAHAAMGVNVIRIDPQRAFEMQSGLCLLAQQKQQIGEIDVPGRDCPDDAERPR